jgi:hypothetical protein
MEVLIPWSMQICTIGEEDDNDDFKQETRLC